MENTIRTIAGLELQVHQLLGLPYNAEKYSTLNEALGFQPEVKIADTEMPTVQYLALGNGGHTTTIGKNDIPIISSVVHTVEDLALFSHIPWVVRLPQEDLRVEERTRYRGRVAIEVNGTRYIAYYLRKIDLSDTKPKKLLRQVRDGVTNTVDYEYSIKNLEPTKPALKPNQHLVTSGDMVSVTAKVPYVLDKNDVDELKNVANIIFGSEDYAIISEVALVSGVDRGVTGDFNGTVMGYVEAIGAQIFSIINTANILTANRDGLEAYLDVGGIEPLMVIKEKE